MPPTSLGGTEAAVLSLTFLALVTCESGRWPASYLDEAVNRETQTEVRQRFGRPGIAAESLGGGSLWTYRFVRGTPGSAAHECWEYALSFDRRGTLRSWTQDHCTEEFPDPVPSQEAAELAK